MCRGVKESMVGPASRPCRARAGAIRRGGGRPADARVRGSGRCGPGGAAGVLELGVDALRFGELIFKDDDAAGSVQRGAVADELVGPGSEAELVAGVAAGPSAGALRCDQPGRVQAAEESWRDAQDLRGAAHAI